MNVKGHSQRTCETVGRVKGFFLLLVQLGDMVCERKLNALSTMNRFVTQLRMSTDEAFMLFLNKPNYPQESTLPLPVIAHLKARKVLFSIESIKTRSQQMRASYYSEAREPF
jgi:hypothetical protein